MKSEYINPICKTCGKPIPLNRPRDRFKQFCNTKCATLCGHKDIIKICAFCKKEFILKYKNQKFCNTTCSSNAKKILHIRYCKKCGKQFILKNLAYEKRGDGQYCSTKCATRQYDVDLDYFKNINTNNKAYWLGFIFSDGYNSGHELIINLSELDENHLIKFKNEIKYSGKITHTIDKTIWKNKISYHNKVRLNISSIDISSELTKLGCVKCKSKIIKFPNISEKYYSDFIRGVFDGDGCISINKHNCATFMIYSESVEYIKSLNLIFSNAGILTHINNKNRVLSISKKSEINKIFHYLYDNNYDFLDRKKDKFIKILTLFNHT